MTLLNMGLPIPLTSGAVSAISSIAKILAEIPEREWGFVLLSGQKSAEKIVKDKNSVKRREND